MTLDQERFEKTLSELEKNLNERRARIERQVDGVFRAAVVTAVIAGLLLLAGVGGAIIVAVHFLSKVW